MEPFLGSLVVKEQDGSGRLEGCGWQCRHHLHNCSVSCWSPGEDPSFKILFRFSHPFQTGLPGVLSCQVHWRELHYDILGKSFFNFNFFLQIMTSTQVGVVMTFVWMNYGRMVEDSTLQTVNTTGLILQVEKLSSELSPYGPYYGW